jgi:O-antigen/teichoic acid export membrane protein
MKIPSFFPSLGLLVLLNVLVKPIWIFAIDRQVQNEVGTATYGSYFALLGFSVFFSFLLDWGLTIYFNRQLASDPEHFTERIGGFLLVKILFSILYAGIVLGIAAIAGIQHWDILILIIIIQVLTSFFVFLRGIVTAYQWFRLDAWLSVLDKTLMIVLCGGFIYYPAVFGEITLTWFLYIQVTCTALAILTVVILLLGRKITFFIRKPYPGKEVIRATLPYALVMLLLSAHFRADGFLLERLHVNGAYEAGLYAGAYRLLDASNMIGFLVASFLIPFISNRLSKRKSIDEVVLSSRHLLFIFSMFIAITVFFYAPWLHDLLYESGGEAGTKVLQWCLPALLGYALVHVYGTVLTARGQLMPFSYIIFASVAINLICNLILIPEWGALGCCFSAIASQLFCGIATMLYARKKSGLGIHPRSLLMYIFIGGLVTGFYFLCRTLHVSNWMQVGLAALFALVLSVHFKLIDITDWKKTYLTEDE